MSAAEQARMTELRRFYREYRANERTDQLLASWYPGMTLGDMTAEAYDRVKAQLIAEHLWLG